MAIGTGAAVPEYGTQTTVKTGTGTLATDTFDTETATALTQNDARVADAVLNTGFSVAPAAGSRIDLYRRDLNINGTGDAPVPDANFKGKFVGSFLVDAITAAADYHLTGIPITKDCEFYIENVSGQTMSTAWVLKVTPWAFNAKA